MKNFEEKWLEIIAIIVSIVALGFSIYSHFKNINFLQT